MPCCIDDSLISLYAKTGACTINNITRIYNSISCQFVLAAADSQFSEMDRIESTNDLARGPLTGGSSSISE